MPGYRVLILLAVILSSGCVQIRETIHLDQNGSGRVRMRTVFPQLALRWLPGKPSVAWLEPNLPNGVRLMSFESSPSHVKVRGMDGKQHELPGDAYEFDLVFDRASALNDIRIRPDTRNAEAAAGGGAPGMRMPNREKAPSKRGAEIGPFQHLTLEVRDDTLHFRRVVQPGRELDETEADRMSIPGSAIKPQAVDLGDAALVVSIHCPGDIMEHNADQVDGRKLTWTFGLAELQQNQQRDWTIEFICRREEGR